MRLLTTKIEGFGPHDLFEIDWTTQGDLVAIVAANGAGKTFLVEADFACLYGDFPSYGGTLYDALTQNSTTPGVLTTTFEVGGTAYEAVRTVKKTAKTVSQTATLTANGNIVAGPKVRDFEQTVETLLGPKHLALASWFSTQGTVGDLANLSAADRRIVFETILDMGRLTEISTKAKDEAATLATEIQTQERTITPVEEYQTQITEMQEQLTIVQSERAEISRLAELEAEALSKMEIDLDRLISLKDAYETSQHRAQSLQTELEDLERQIDEYTSSIAKHKADAAQLDALDAELLLIEEAEECLKQYQAIDAWQTENERLANDVATKKDAVTTHEDYCAVTPEQQALVDDLGNRIKALTVARQEVANEQAIRFRHEGRIEELKSQLDPDVETFHADPVPAEACHTCVLHRNSRRMVDDLLQAEQDLAEIERTPEGLIEALEADVAEATEAASQYRQRPLAQLEILRKQYKHATRLLETHQSQRLPEPSCDQELALERSHRLRSTRDKRQQSLSASSLLVDLSPVLDTLRTRHTTCRTELLDVREAIRQYDDREYAYDLSLLTQDVADAKRQLTSYRQTELASASLEGSVTQQLESLTLAQSKDAALTKTLKKHRKRVEYLKTLQKAFGKQGLQAILIDSAVETLETHCNTFLQAVGGGLQLAIVTQTETRDGRNRETLEVLVTDSAGQRPVGRLSGGERRLISTVLRLGITLWASQLSGRACSTLRIDEAFDALDDTRSQEMITLLSELQDVFDQIVVITHNHNLATQFPARITL